MCETECKTRVNCKGCLKKDDPRWLLKPSKMPTNLRQSIDHDYVDELSHDEAAWLQNFDDGYYTGAKNGVSNEWDKSDLTEAYQRNRARRRDVYNNFNRTTNVDCFASKHISKAKNNRNKEE